ncbi:peptidylprolyl isomerase [aff. Roholtiella sp. LEGE 12411]|uniref:peptidylprolyl isomerase n=1 Tax=aff. Roholtiella sp. LEGE 12411 TaxID=1828822 RepID=UPI00187E600A|nr:peptidylprolyl isomerase [aff. Roholtiella sp. LEGE 12411]MBE9036404.1 peptidylprolyl isomerase [aff. Roholtiella sp. LEGE 12411]
MTVVLRVGNRTITTKEIVSLLAGYQLLPRLLFELIVDDAIAPFTCTLEETQSAQQQFCEKNQLNSHTEIQTWLKRNGMTPEQLQTYAVRSLRIEKFQQATWGNQLESVFRSRKSEFDQVLFSLIKTDDLAVQELYFRIQEKETDFAALASQYSEDPSASNGGLIGPIHLSKCHPTLAKMLANSQPGQLWPPTRLGEWVAIVRLEKFISAQLDNLMRQRLLSELFATWLQEQFNEMGEICLFPVGIGE